MQEFTSFAQFGRHLAKVAAKGEAVADHMTKVSAQVVKDDAQWRIGAYQDAVGPFNAWEPLAHSTVMDRIRKGYTPFDPLLRTGEMRDSIAVDVTGQTAVIGSDSDIAVWQELGTKHIPPRPFLGPAAAAAGPKIGHATAAILIAWLCGERWRKPQSIRLP